MAKYLGVVLDRSLTYKVHCEKTKMKIKTRNGLLRKLVWSARGCRTACIESYSFSTLFLNQRFRKSSVGKVCTHKKIDTALNETCWLITGCLKNTPVNKLYRYHIWYSPTWNSTVQPSWLGANKSDEWWPAYNAWIARRQIPT